MRRLMILLARCVALVLVTALVVSPSPEAIASPYHLGALAVPGSVPSKACTNQGCIGGRCSKQGGVPGSNCKVTNGHCVDTAC